MAVIINPGDMNNASSVEMNAYRLGSLQRANKSAPTPSLAKRLFDVAVSAPLLLFAIPLLALIGLLILLLNGRPIFIRHPRVGKDGRAFLCLKFRTMVVDAEAALIRHLAASPSARQEWEASRKLRDDPRVTALGQALRQSSLDELPQLLNVLRGEMSLVGPRPIVAEETKYYGHNLHYYLATRPGITGLWQISGRSDVSYEHRVSMDVQYVRNWSLVRDIVILVLTAPSVIRSKGAR